ncbi:MAG: L,D-transpeptidase family protein [Alphaproteobacteria bacterium]|nr:L,D-transpeptidase family protein [Alphaproteobacteria bacterium]
MDDLIGETTTYEIQAEDNLYALARQFDLGIVDLLAANPGVDPWMPREKEALLLPAAHILPTAPRKGIVINLSEMRLYYFPDSHSVMTFPIGIGREGWETPLGRTIVAHKRENPAWIPPPSIRHEHPDLPEYFPPGPDNPLGAFALDLGWEAYRIHGTNKPSGIGVRSSHGCIRLYPEDIATLFPLVKVGTPVTVVDEPYKLGWSGDQLWLEISPTQQQADIIADYGQPSAIDRPGIHASVEQAAGKGAAIDWYRIDEALAQATGIPVLVAERHAP